MWINARKSKKQSNKAPSCEKIKKPWPTSSVTWPALLATCRRVLQKSLWESTVNTSLATYSTWQRRKTLLKIKLWSIFNDLSVQKAQWAVSTLFLTSFHLFNFLKFLLNTYLGPFYWPTIFFNDSMFSQFSVKFLEVIKPFCSILPEIAKPERKVSFSGF